jgi:NAD-dependent dihydropyrimidine dehydrogenase PreA subunit
MSEESYEGIPREKIVWHPIINYEKCTTCGKCVEFCHAKAYGFEGTGKQKKTIVKDLNACVVLCRGCEDICPAGALSHPSVEETEKSIKKLQEAALS